MIEPRKLISAGAFAVVGCGGRVGVSQMAWHVGPAGVGEQGKRHNGGSPGTWEILSSPRKQSRLGIPGDQLQARRDVHSAAAGETKRPNAPVVPPSEGNEARRDGRQEVVACLIVPWKRGNSAREDPVEGSGTPGSHPLEGNMPETSNFEYRVHETTADSELAKQNPQMAFTSLNHYLDVEWLREAFHPHA